MIKYVSVEAVQVYRNNCLIDLHLGMHMVCFDGYVPFNWEEENDKLLLIECQSQAY